MIKLKIHKLVFTLFAYFNLVTISAQFHEVGAFIGARMEENSDGNKAIKIALGALAGFFAGTMLKLSVSVYICYIIFQAIPSLW